MSTNPFGESDLALIDLSTDLWYDGQERPRKRIRAHLPIGHLADLASKHDRAFNALVARAHFEAEVTRASTLHAAVDESRALAGYDPNPFNWTGGTRLDICYLWNIRTPGGCERQLSFVRLNELISGGAESPLSAACLSCGRRKPAGKARAYGDERAHLPSDTLRLSGRRGTPWPIREGSAQVAVELQQVQSRGSFRVAERY